MYVGRVLADRPYGFWSLDAASPFVDLSGNENNATATGTYKYSNTLVAGGGKSLVVNSAYTPSFEFPLLQVGYERRNWSWELWFHPLDSSSLIYLLEHEAATLSYNNGWLTFTIDFVDSTALIEYEVLVREALYIVVTHTESRISLFVNGQLVGSSEITDAQNASGYDIVSPTNILLSGTASTDQILIDSVAVYGYDLSPAKVRTHFTFGRDTSTVSNVVMQNLGYYFEPNDLDADVYMKLAWDTDQDFNTSPLSDVTISNGLKPALDETGSPIPSSWVMPINMNAMDTTIVEYVRIGWVGRGTLEVELSTDGITWNPVTNDVAIALASLDIKEAIFEIRISFDGTDEDATISYLDFTVYKTTAIRGSLNPRHVSYDGIVTIARVVNEPIEHNFKRGADISAGGRIYATPDEEADSKDIKTLDVWVNFDMSQPFGIFDMRSVGNTTRPYLSWNGTDLDHQGIDKLYVNGILVDPDTWTPTSNSSCLVTAVLATPSNYGVYFGSPYTGGFITNGQIESFAFYETEPSAAHVLRMYNSYYGIVTDVINDSSSVAILEDAIPYEVYAYPWSITGAG